MVGGALDSLKDRYAAGAEAHLYGAVVQFPAYEPMALSKQAGELECARSSAATSALGDSNC